MLRFFNISYLYRLLLRNIPNIFTLTATTLAMLGLYYAIHHLFFKAILFVFVAAIMDGLDGRAARLLKQDSSLGAQLDSFSDLLSFGVITAFINYFWILYKLHIYGFLVVILFSLCSLLRLAKFNVQTNKASTYSSQFFYGLPMPMAAGFALYPIAFIVLTHITFNSNILSILIAIWLVIISLLMVTPLPLFSFKKILNWQVLVLLLILGIVFHNQQWFLILVGVMLLIYVLLIPFSVLYHYKKHHRLQKNKKTTHTE